MTFKKSSRAGLFALAFGILIGLFLSVATYEASYAQAQAPAAPHRRLLRRLAQPTQTRKKP